MDPIREMNFKSVLMVAGVLFSVTMMFDRFFSDRGIWITSGIFLFHYWALKICMTLFLICCGISYHFGMNLFFSNVLSYFVTLGRRHEMCAVQFWAEVISGFIVTWITFPIWLGVRDGTIGCFLDRKCKSCITSLYLEIADLICDTPTSGSLTIDSLPICEEIFYTLPIILFTLTSLGLTISLYLQHKNNLEIEVPLPSPSRISETIVTSELYRRPQARIERIRFSLPVQHVPPSSSHVFAD